MSITLTVLLALLLDACLGKPRRFHPLAGFRLTGCVALLLANSLEATHQQDGFIVNHDTDQLDHALTHTWHIPSSLTEHAP
jgi:hypothetical protein